MNVIETERLNLRRMTAQDAGFILELLNDPSFIRNIGNKRVRTIEDARLYILNGPCASYERFGFGLYLVEIKESGESVGICGLIKRESLADVDIGFAFLPSFWGKGYAFESASAVKAYALQSLHLPRIVAITNPDNEGSIRVLEKIGLKFERMVRMPEDEFEIKLYASNA